MLLSLRNYVKMSVAPSEKMCFLHHFDICDKRGDHITDIDPFLFGKKFDISISGKYAEQNEQVFTDVHLYYGMSCPR